MNPWHFLIFVGVWSLVGVVALTSIRFYRWVRPVYLNWRYPKLIVMDSDFGSQRFIAAAKFFDQIPKSDRVMESWMAHTYAPPTSDFKNITNA